jgi:metal-responsive CopG/Arc/MetJ family transcriptional regulator
MVDQDYVSVRVPRKLMTEVDRFVRHRVLGFRSRAELVVDAIRRRLEGISELERLQAKLK